MTPQAPVLELQDVEVELGGEVILSDINLQVFPRDVIVIVGMSGSGKSVLLRTMVGLIHPNRGKVLIEGRRWSDMSREDLHSEAHKIGMQFQKSALFDDLTAAENIEFVLKEHTSLTPEQRRARAIECLQSVNLEKSADLSPFEMSGGMRQRVGIARALALKPEILIIDDPTAGLDPVNADAMADMIMKLNSDLGSTLIVVTHDIMRAYQFGGTLYLIANQKLTKVGTSIQAESSRDPLIHQFVTGAVHGPLTDGGTAELKLPEGTDSDFLESHRPTALKN
jgi:phospholipid/cholesterol/gamma-HCH transport system ATP-binding protein